jgi:hypothetical protein
VAGGGWLLKACTVLYRREKTYSQELGAFAAGAPQLGGNQPSLGDTVPKEVSGEDAAISQEWLCVFFFFPRAFALLL